MVMSTGMEPYDTLKERKLKGFGLQGNHLQLKGLIKRET